MSGINTMKQYPGSVITYATDWNTSIAHTTQTPLNCNGYNSLMVYYYPSTGWDRAGTITIYGALAYNDTYVPMDATNESASFGVLHTDDTGEIYVVENIPIFVKLDWANTTAGATGTLTVKVMPFNS